MKSKGKKEKAVINKDEDAEDWCFVCKDGGDLLRICDYKKCLKAYHPVCVDEDDSFLESDDPWTCPWHTCYNCHKPSYLHCYTCTKAACQRCRFLPDADLFHVIKQPYGFCNSCLDLALLIEDGKDLDPDEGEGFLITDYYNFIKEQERFELRDLLDAKERVKTAKKSRSGSEADDYEVEDQISDDSDGSDYDGTEHVKKTRRKRVEKRSGRKKYGMRTPIKSKKNEFIGWGSRSLIDFLSSIGKSTDEKLSERDVTSIVNEYVKDNKLLDPPKMKMILCDGKLQSLFKKRRVHKNKVRELLESHFVENLDESEEDEVEYDSEDEIADIPDVSKRRRKLDMERKSSEEELADDVQLGRFASIVVENVKLVYLRRSVLLEMLKQPESFEEKVVGCFVRVKSDPYDYHSRNSHLLMQVRGVGRVSTDQMEAVLLFSDMPEEISTNMLSGDDFTKEECEHLAQKVLAGQLERPTVEDLQKKANIVHADITNHWITKRMASLRNLIDRANEKGWRCEFYEYWEERKRLQTPSEVSKLLENVPKVIPDLHELSTNSEDIINDMSCEKNSPKSILQCNSSIANEGWQDNKASEVKTHHHNASSPERTQLSYAGPNSDNATSSKLSQPNAVLKNNKLGEEELDICPNKTPHELATSSSHKAPERTLLIYAGPNSDNAMSRNPSQDSQPSAELKTNKVGVEELEMCSNETPRELATSSSHKAPERTRLIYAGPNSDNAMSRNPSQDSQPSAELKTNKVGGEELEMCSNETPHELATSSSHKASVPKFIDLLSDDENSNEGKPASVVCENQNINDTIWCIEGPNGVRGKYSFSVLRRWSENSVHAFKFKVWREGEDENNAVWLREAVSIAFPKK